MNKQDKDLKRQLKDLGKIIEILTEDIMQLKIALEKSEQQRARLLAFDRNGNAYFVDEGNKYQQVLKEINNNLAEILATIEEEGKPNNSIVDTIWCKNIPCCTLWELVEGMQNKINEVLNEQ